MDGWIGHALTPDEAFKNLHIFNGKTTNAKGIPLVSDQTNGYYDPPQKKTYEELGNLGFLSVTVQDETGKPVSGATVRLPGDPLQEMTSTAQGIANFKSYLGRAPIEVSPPEKLGLKLGRGESFVESMRIIQLTVVLKKKPADFKIAIMAPSNGTKVQEADVVVTGTLSDQEVPQVVINFNGKPITVSPRDKQFSATVTLQKGENVFFAEAEQTSSESIKISLDKPSS